MKELLPDAIVPSGPDGGLVRVTRSLQVGIPIADDREGATPASGPSDAFSSEELPKALSGATSRSLSDADASFSESDCSESVDAVAPAAPNYDERADGRPRLHVPYPHLFCVGDSADAYGAIKAGHTAYWQAEVAARNIIKMVRAEAVRERLASLRSAGAAGEGKDCLIEELEGELVQLEDLEKYAPGAPAIKVSLGLVSESLLLLRMFANDVACRISLHSRSTAKSVPSQTAPKTLM
jgi:apoptosis-inducing factor 2